MAKHVAFLRGVNVGGRNIKMADVKGCFENMGFADVSTVIQSGNVLFEASGKDSAQLKKMIEAGLSKRFAYDARVQVYPLERLAKIVEACPFQDNDSDYHSYVVFMEGGLAREFVHEPIELETWEALQPGDGVVYWRCRKGQTLASRVSKYLAKARYRDFNTNRNLNTLKKIVGGR